MKRTVDSIEPHGMLGGLGLTLVILAAVFALCGCTEEKAAPAPDATKDEEGFRYAHFQGHRYVFLYLSAGSAGISTSVVHDPDCPKCAAKLAGEKTALAAVVATEPPQKSFELNFNRIPAVFPASGAPVSPGPIHPDPATLGGIVPQSLEK